MASCAGDAHESPRRSPAQDVRENVDGLLVDIAPDALAAARESGVDLAGTVRSAIQLASGLLGDVRTDLSVVVDPERTIAGIGVGGYTDPNTGDVTISLDDAPGRRIATWLPVTVAYELDHVARVNHGPGFGSTLLEVMVTEGMADAFATQAYPAAPAHPWAEALPAAADSVGPGQPSLDELQDLHGYAKVVPGEARLPAWTGFSIGSGIVSSYLARHPEERASDLVTVSAQEVLRGSGWMATTGPPTG